MKGLAQGGGTHGRAAGPGGPDAADAWLNRYQRLAWLFDESIEIPILRWRIGLDALVGLVPGLGDLVVATLGGYALAVAARLRAPAPVLLRMVANVGVDTLVGAVPLLGDLFDMAWKANTRNRRLLERWLADPRRTERRSRWTLVGVALVFVAVVGLSFWLVVVIVAALLRALF
jgi:hypothetical protein